MNKFKLKIKYKKKYKNHLIVLVLLIVIIAAYFILDRNPSLADMIPESTQIVFLEKTKDESRESNLKMSFSAEEVVSAEYGIKGLLNSKIMIDLIKYNESTYDEWNELHRASEFLSISGEEILVPCNDTIILGKKVKSCVYSKENINIIKNTISFDNKKIVGRVLCAEGELSFAKMRCSEICGKIIKRGE